MRGPQAAHDDLHDTGPLPAVHVAMPVEDARGGLRVPLTIAGATAALALVAYAVLANKNASDAAAGVADHGPRITRVETKVESVEKKIDGMDAKIDKILERLPPK